jgi:ATP-dependent RNA helicase DeaD
MVSVEFNRFINYYKKTRDIQINLQVLKDVMTEMVLQEKIIMVVQRYFVNIGSRDNLIGCH